MKTKDELMIRWEVREQGHPYLQIAIFKGALAWDMGETLKEKLTKENTRFRCYWKHGNWFKRLFWSRMFTIDDLKGED